MSDSSIPQTAALLAEVFPGTRVGDERYLRWLYADSPSGPVVEVNRTDGLGTSAHYAVVPVDLAVDGADVRGALSLNTAVHERARGGGVFVKLATETYDLAAARGVEVIVGVANANSTPGFERRLGFTIHGPLPATVLLPTPGRRGGVTSARAGTPAGDLLVAGAAPLLVPPPTGLTRRWTPETLRWRLASPGAGYVLHRTPDALMVTTAERRSGLAVGVILAVFARAPLSRAGRAALVRAACRTHRAPFALHVGHNALAAFGGPPLPERLRPSPLNLISRDLRAGDGATTPLPAPSRFEFLDFDAY